MLNAWERMLPASLAVLQLGVGGGGGGGGGASPPACTLPLSHELAMHGSQNSACALNYTTLLHTTTTLDAVFGAATFMYNQSHPGKESCQCIGLSSYS